MVLYSPAKVHKLMASGLGTEGAVTVAQGVPFVQEQVPGGGGGGAVQAAQATVVMRQVVLVPQAAFVLM